MTVLKQSAVTNSLLANLPRAHYQRLASGLDTVTLNFGDVLLEPGDKIRHVYFPERALVSLLTLVDGRSALEIGMVGPEGMVGTALALGVGVSPVRALVQGAGGASRMTSARFLRELQQSLPLRQSIYRFTHTLMAQVAQTAACNRFHVVEERLARWLLMTRDRLGATSFPLTQEFLAHMLGVRREGVTAAAGSLQKRKLIEYSRGNIVIIDEGGLEAATCSCYQIVRDLNA